LEFQRAISGELPMPPTVARAMVVYCRELRLNGKNQESIMRQLRSFATAFTFAGIAFSALLGIAGVTASSQPAGAVVYCTYVGYPTGCVARAGVVLHPRPVARAAVRTGTVGATNLNGGVNRVGVRR
jgi:hypothetical protein